MPITLKIDELYRETLANPPKIEALSCLGYSEGHRLNRENVLRFTNESLLAAWQAKGGRFESGPKEMALIPKDMLLTLLQELTAVPERGMLVEPLKIQAGHPGVPDKVWRMAQRLANELEHMPLREASNHE